jgi:hypothetical protein
MSPIFAAESKAGMPCFHHESPAPALQDGESSSDGPYHLPP